MKAEDKIWQYFLRNVGIYLPNYTVSHTRRPVLIPLAVPRLNSADPRVESQAVPCASYGGQSGNETGFRSKYFSVPVSINPTMLSIKTFMSPTLDELSS